MYHKEIGGIETFWSIFNSAGFLSDVITDIQYMLLFTGECPDIWVNEPCTKVTVQNNFENAHPNFDRINNFPKFIKIIGVSTFMISSIVIPFSYELIQTFWGCNLQTVQYRLTLYIARILNQDKCLSIPEQKEDIAEYHQTQGKENAKKYFKFVLLEDFIQANLQLYLSIMYGMFSGDNVVAILSPGIGMF